jgi:RimJ/RimL family protein N-acetyltransferase
MSNQTVKRNFILLNIFYNTNFKITKIFSNWCNKGYGTKLLKSISDWCFDNGIEKIKFDVLSTNNRAIKSYRNAGYKIIGEFKCGDAMFYWMESRFK